jgi:creatinine amidohydrolase/Fe(II)-dependent formamide hydrolase-like protein
MKRRPALMWTLVIATGLGAGAPGAAQQRNAQAQSRRADMNTMERPIEMANEVWLAELTVLEVRDLIREGKTTGIIMTGGIESNGPYLVTGKHNFVLEAVGESIARRLGNALLAPVMTIEPGNPETASSPGGIRLSQETYMAVMRDMATSMKAQGFTNILLFGDSGGNQRGMEAVANELNEAWRGSGSRAHYIREYYYEDIWSCEFLKNELNIHQQPDDCSATRDLYHDDVHYSSIVATTDPARIRVEQRMKTDQLSINGVSLAPLDRTLEVGRRLIEYRTDITVRAIQKAISGS